MRKLSFTNYNFAIFPYENDSIPLFDIKNFSNRFCEGNLVLSGHCHDVEYFLHFPSHPTCRTCRGILIYLAPISPIHRINQQHPIEGGL